MEINQTKTVPVEAKTLKLHLKVCDMFTATLCDQDGATIHDQEEGYVPDFMPEQHCGDYVILDIDIDTGLITNWKTPTPKALQEWIGGEEED